MKFTKFKTKVIFTLGIYFLVWRHAVVKALRDDFGAQLEPGKELLLAFVPFINILRWWAILNEIKAVGERTGAAEVLSPGHGMFSTIFWFAGGPYVNKHMNALYGARAGTYATASVQAPVAATY
ncbi:MAG TPA: hypothetical protein VME46_02615 [Acidimicrobiales bacterium]|nr:hypothetical protein [Acidimicrobiales bacterium]